MLKTNETGNAVAGGKAGKLLLRALAGETLPAPPVWLMRQAGRYLPEYRKLRAEAGSFLDLCYNPQFATEVTLQPIRRFGFDAAILFADILLVPHALGQSLTFVEGEGPLLPPLKGLQDIKALDRGRMHDRLAPVYETVRRLSKELPEEVTLIGFAGAPWTVATYMVEGGGSRDHAATKRWAFTEPASFQKLIDLLVVSTADYLIAQVEAGAEVVQLFDTWAGALPESGFRRWCVEPAARIVARLNDACPGVPVIGFPRGVGAGAAIFASETGVAGLGLDWAQPLGWVAETLQTKLTVQGNLDPMLLAAGGEAMATDARRILEVLGKGPFIFNLGHGILPHTPPEHVSELMAIVRGRA